MHNMACGAWHIENFGIWYRYNGWHDDARDGRSVVTMGTQGTSLPSLGQDLKEYVLGLMKDQGC